MPDVIPSAAIDYIKNKKLKPGFSYKDVWHEEHATAFTVAKAMQTDVLSDLHKAVTAAIEKGQSFESFRKNITPVLREKGWWGRKEMTDPVTGKTVAAQLGSDRRLKTIYDTNRRAAFIQQRYKDIMEDDIVTHIIYRAGNSRRNREEHLAWDGLVLPKDDPWWGLHMPRKEYGCKCTIDGVGEAELRRYKRMAFRWLPGSTAPAVAEFRSKPPPRPKSTGRTSTSGNRPRSGCRPESTPPSTGISGARGVT